MKLPGLVLVLFSFVRCGGESFVAQAVSLSPDSGELVDSQGIPATDGEGKPAQADRQIPDSWSAGETAASRDVLADPWPEDVTVQPMPDGPPSDARPPDDALVCHNPPCHDPMPCLNCFYVGPGSSAGSLAWGCCPTGANIPGGKCRSFEPGREYGYCGNCGC